MPSFVLKSGRADKTMEYGNVKELIGIIDGSSITEFEYKQGEFYVRMSKSVFPSGKKNFKESKDAGETVTEEISSPITIIPAEKEDVKEGSFVKAPIVGTFYQSTNPDRPPIVKVGDKVKEGDLLCIIEAMKIMNEIKSPYNGEIAEILVSNEEMVEYGQSLFRIV